MYIDNTSPMEQFQRRLLKEQQWRREYEERHEEEEKREFFRKLDEEKKKNTIRDTPFERLIKDAYPGIQYNCYDFW